MVSTISNFRDYEITGRGPLTWEYRAVVDVTTEVPGKWFFSKLKTVTVPKSVARQYAGSWFFVDSGEWTPGYEVEALERAYKAKNGIPL